MPRIHYNRANADPTLDGLDWKPHPDGGLVSPDLPDEVASRYEQFKGFSLIKPRGSKGAAQAPAPAVPPADAAPAGTETTAGAAGSDSIDGGTGAPPAPPASTVPGAGLPDIF